MLLLVGYIIRTVTCIVIGVIFGMPVRGIILLAVVANIAIEIIGLAVVAFLGEGVEVLNIVITAIFLVVMLINYSSTPNDEERYIPGAGIVASLDGKEAINLRDINVNEPFYLQIKVSVQSESWARNIFGDNNIPFTIEVSNPEVSTFSEPQDVQNCKETEPVETIRDKLLSLPILRFFKGETIQGETITKKLEYHYTVHAAGKPKMAVIVFKVTPKQAGSQVIKITYDKKVSDIHTRTVTLEYKN